MYANGTEKIQRNAAANGCRKQTAFVYGCSGMCLCNTLNITLLHCGTLAGIHKVVP
ncbi:MAG: hypothetical protein KIS94_03550 [Chitinophagales bacterium]|nr:hypothetical protein [Chitinophagales bacterium]